MQGIITISNIKINLKNQTASQFFLESKTVLQASKLFGGQTHQLLPHTESETKPSINRLKISLSYYQKTLFERQVNWPCQSTRFIILPFSSREIMWNLCYIWHTHTFLLLHSPLGALWTELLSSILLKPSFYFGRILLSLFFLVQLDYIIYRKKKEKLTYCIKFDILKKTLKKPGVTGDRPVNPAKAPHTS